MQTGMETESGAEEHRDRDGQSHIHLWWIKNGRDVLGVRDPSPPSPDHPAHGSSARKISPHNFWL